MRVASGFFVALLAGVMMLTVASPSHAQVSIGVGVSIRVAPPVLPVYVQPACPGDGYLWTPGYWAYGPDGYYWVPGTWVRPPQVGFLWTPGYWGWGGGVYAWHVGYWGPHVGFYGGVNYGFGYVGVGYAGGFWDHGAFNYNRTVNNVNVTVEHNTFNKTVINNTTVNRVSYNGGTGGITAQPSAEERAAASEQHVAPTGEQTAHEHAASTNRAQLASVNHGQPSVAATGKAGEFSGKNVVAANRAGGANAGAAGEKAAYRPPAANGSANARGAENASRPAGTPAGQNVARNNQAEKAPKKAASHPNKPPKDEHSGDARGKG